jgi:hypothetical protein
VILTLALMATAARSTDMSVEDQCKSCTYDGSKIFLKIIFRPMFRPEYVCRESALLVSKFGIVVDRSCTPDGCRNNTSTPIVRKFSRTELGCSDSDLSEHGTDIQLITIVKDYVEIIVMSTFLAILLLKKSLLEKCIKNELYILPIINTWRFSLKRKKVKFINLQLCSVTAMYKALACCPT